MFNCKTCGQVKSESDFYKSNSSKCKQCISQYNKRRTEKIARLQKVEPKDKPCRRCGVIKQPSEFGKISKNLDGLDTMCKQCKKESRQKRYKKNAEIAISVDADSVTRECCTCGETKVLSLFVKDNRRASGYTNQCKQCEYSRERGRLSRVPADKLREREKAKRERRKAMYESGEVEIPTEKMCGRCKEVKHRDCFAVSRSSTNGLSSTCKQCQKEYSQRPDVIERERERSRRRAAKARANRRRPSKIPDSRVRLGRKFVVDRERFRELISRASTGYASEQKRLEANAYALARHHEMKSDPEYQERVKKSRQKYRQSEYGKKKRDEKRKQRRASERGAAGKASAEQIAARYEYHGNRCIYCGCGGKMTLEHIIPLSHGGTHWPANLAPACHMCNSTVGNTDFRDKVAAMHAYG